MKPLTTEHVRILRAASEGRLFFNAAGRWQIMRDHRRPQRRARELLLRRGLLRFDEGLLGRVDAARGALSRTAFVVAALEARLAGGGRLAGRGSESPSLRRFMGGGDAVEDA